ncbi:MAG: hypothetical protein AB1497_06820 [Bacillota bacterium]
MILFLGSYKITVEPRRQEPLDLHSLFRRALLDRELEEERQRQDLRYYSGLVHYR